MTRIRRSYGAVLLLGLVAVLLSGCMKMDMDLTVSSDNTVSGTFIFGFEKSVLEATGQSAEDMTEGAMATPIPGSKAEPYSDDKFAGVKYTFDSVPLEEFNKTSGEGGDLQINREGDTFVVSGTMDLSSTGDAGMDPAMQDQMEAAFATAEISISVTFPGAVEDSNGQVSGNTVTWTPKFGEKTELQATASAIGGGGGGMMMWLIVGAIVLVAVIVIIVVLASRKGKGAAPAGAPEQWTGTEATPMAPGPAATEVPPAPPEAPQAPQAPPAPPQDPPAGE